MTGLRESHRACAECGAIFVPSERRWHHRPRILQDPGVLVPLVETRSDWAVGYGLVRLTGQ